MENEADLHGLHEALAELARSVARELTSEHPDMERVADLDAQRAVLHERIRRATPPRGDDHDLYRGRDC